jgi:membrane-associated phospholipid phosphatase
VLELSRFRLVADSEGATGAEDVEGAGTDGAGADEAAETEAEIVRGPLPGFRDTLNRDLKELPGLLWHDTKAVYGNPWNVLFLVGAGGVSVALRPEVDDKIEDHYREHHTFSGDWPDAFGAMGNPATHFALAGAWYLIGQQAEDAKTYEVGKRMISALTITGVSTMLLKVAACTEAPNGEDFAWPSGHVSSTMALATVLNHAYGPLVGVPMYGLTALVGIERLDDEEHHFSDVVFGAALGWVVAETVMKEHHPEIFGGEVVPYVDPAGRNAGIAWVKSLGN